MVDMSDIVKDVQNTFKKTNPDIIFDPNKKIEAIESGNITFDLISQIGGFPRRRLTEVFGMEHSGKTSLLYEAFARLQRRKGVGVLFDFEGAWDPVFAKNCFGLVEDKKYFTIFSPLTIEEGGVVLEKLFQQKKGGGFLLDQLDLVGFDSVDAMKPKELIECSLDKTRQLGLQAQSVGRWVAKVRYACQQMGFASVFTNQMRVNIRTTNVEQNVGTGSGYNTQETHVTPGGYALRFYASLRMKLEYGGQDQDESAENIMTGQTEKQRVGNQIKVINIKNKVGIPFLKGVTNFDFPVPGQKGGWNRGKDIIDILKKRGRIAQRSTKFIYNGLDIEEWTNIGSKRDSESKFVEDEALMADAEKLIYHLMDQGHETLLDRATTVDLKPEDIAGQDDPHSVNAIDVKELVAPAEECSEDDDPLEEKTL